MNNSKKYNEIIEKRKNTIAKKLALKLEKQKKYAVSEKKEKRESTIDYKKNYKKKFEEAIKKNQEHFLKISKAVLKEFNIDCEIFVEIGFLDKKYNTWKKYEEVKFDSCIIYAKNEGRAINEAVQIMKNKHTYDHQYMYSIVKKVLIKSVIKKESIIKHDAKKMKMRKATDDHLSYNFIPEDISKLENKGLCVFDNFLKTYEPLIMKLNKNKFIELCNKVSPIDENNIMDGVTPEQLLYVCKYFNISMYAYNISQECFLKHIAKSTPH